MTKCSGVRSDSSINLGMLRAHLPQLNLLATALSAASVRQLRARQATEQP